MSAGAGTADSPSMRPSVFSWRGEDAQTMAEYVVVLAVITPIVLLAFAGISGAVLTAIENVRGFL
jgi:Flp pilus assembly pilin Flp